MAKQALSLSSVDEFRGLKRIKGSNISSGFQIGHRLQRSREVDERCLSLLDLPQELFDLIWDFIFGTFSSYEEKIAIFYLRVVCRKFDATILHLAYKAVEEEPKREIDGDPCFPYEASFRKPRREQILAHWINNALADVDLNVCRSAYTDQQRAHLLVPNLSEMTISRILLSGLDIAPSNSLTMTIRRVAEEQRFGLLYLSVLTLGRVKAVLYFTQAKEEKVNSTTEKNYPFLLSAYQGRFCQGDEIEDPIFGDTLITAIVGGQEETVMLLLRRGCSLQYRDWNRQNLLHWAAIRGLHRVLEKVSRFNMLKYGYSTDRRQRTPLSYAAEYGYTSAVKLFLEKAHDVAKTRDCRGRLPLHYAAREGHEGVLRCLLIDDPTTVYSIDSTGMTPEVLARREGHAKAVNLLVLGHRKNIREEILKEPAWMGFRDLNPPSELWYRGCTVRMWASCSRRLPS
ncbi:hypothetical protein AJ80_05062 [Polytolypa hystricis UAMH7299]|uniref:Uncharacterized protein n=1 Tax=Polytolypa hystricis (strain UAMH7299) TaxID=1447883 RepID=A0A2B7Y7L7_POLH7|nr:hypothetical protein AJ80_05062 [Polytolypa hystricis UAMH7299]